MQNPAHSHGNQQDADACPYCGQDITHDQLVEIEERIAKEHKAQFEQREKQLSAQHMAETSKLHTQLANLQSTNAAALIEEKKKHEKALAEKEKTSATQIAEARKAERAAAEKEQVQAALKIQQDREALEAERKNMSEEKNKQEQEHKQALEQQRKLLEDAGDKKLREQSAQSEKENARLKKIADDLTRKLEKKSNDELGDGAEVELFDDLREAFPDDKITRVQKGVAGCDIKHEIHVDGRTCGKIVYDSKNRKDWKASYVEQLRKDQLAEKADHAILATRRFPKNTKELSVMDNVLLVNPARAVVIAGVMRDSLVQLSSIKLSEQGKKEKQAELYEFITSTRCDNLFKRAANQVDKIRELDVKEKNTQENTRKNRAKLVGELEKAVLGELQDELNTIIGV